MSASPVPRVVSLAESRVLVVGGTSGVGLETASEFAGQGAAVAVVGRNAERGARAVQAIRERATGASVWFCQGDCNEPQGALRACGEARERLGGIDVLVNSTMGAFGPRLLSETRVEDIGPILTGQIMAPLLTSRIVLPWMTEQGGGAIVNVASDAGKVTTPGETVIGAVMAGIIMFSRTLAIEARRHGIRVNAVTPSIISDTPTYDMVMADPFSGKLFAKAIRMAQLGVVNPTDLAGLIVFLASPAAAKISGQAISCNGGISAA